MVWRSGCVYSVNFWRRSEHQGPSKMYPGRSGPIAMQEGAKPSVTAITSIHTRLMRHQLHDPSARGFILNHRMPIPLRAYYSAFDDAVKKFALPLMPDAVKKTALPLMPDAVKKSALPLMPTFDDAVKKFVLPLMPNVTWINLTDVQPWHHTYLIANLSNTSN